MGLLYRFIRPLLFSLDAEKAHHLALKAVSLLPGKALPVEKSPIELWGITFPNRIGLAAGLDKNGDYIDGLAKLGFGFIEVGTVTPRPQQGNPKPRLFRAVHQQAIINRMGFNNKGIDYLIGRLANCSYQGVIGINIGKNKDTPDNDAVKDYLICLEKAYAYASYITVNVSSPNTPGLRALQSGDVLYDLLMSLVSKRRVLAEQHNKWVPLLVKVSPDENNDAVQAMVTAINQSGIEGIIATNTTVDKSTLGKDDTLRLEAGGLSGQPLQHRATSVLSTIRGFTHLPLIGVGGIDRPSALQAKFDAGASLVQVYSGLIYQGPGLVKNLLKKMP